MTNENDNYNFNAGDDGAGGGGDGVSGGAGNSGGDFNFNEFKSNYGKNYLEKPYMKDIDSPERLFKELDNAQGLIGKKLSFPGAEANDKEHDEYLDLIRPKDTGVYTFNDSKLPDNLKGLHPQGIEDNIKGLFQKAALTPKQANIIHEGYDELMLNLHGEALSKYAETQKANTLADADFEAMADKTWGQDREGVQNVARALLQQYTTPEFKPHVDNLSNENLIVLASVLKGVSDKYISQDDLSELKGGSTGGMNADSLRGEAQKKMTELLSMSAFDKGYEEKKQEVDDIYARLGKMSGDK